MGRYKFSIIIPTFNSERHLRHCLQNIVKQTYSDFEVVVVDGMSTDSTLKILKEYAELYSCIRWISEKDEGIYDAMNKGMRIATGEWLNFLGSDDSFHDENVLLNVANEIGAHDPQVVYGNALIRGTTPWAKNNEIYAREFDLKKLMIKNICHQAIFYQRDFIKDIGQYNLSYKLCADWDFNLRCWSKGKFVYIDRILVNFYAGGESTRNDNDTAFSNDFVKNLMNYFRFDIFHRNFELPDFSSKGEVLRLQRQTDPIRWFVNRIRNKFFRK